MENGVRGTQCNLESIYSPSLFPRVDSTALRALAGVLRK